jgi:hypothetical protein
MKHERLLDRREFTAEGALAALAGVVITIGGCGGGGGYESPSSPGTPSPPSGGGSPSDESGTISANHGHVAMVTGAELVAGNAVQIDIRGEADHNHQVTLAVEAVRSIQAGRPVVTDSTSAAGHLHTVTFNGESSEPPERY